MEVGTFSAGPPYMLYIYILCVSLSHSLSIYIYTYIDIHITTFRTCFEHALKIKELFGKRKPKETSALRLNLTYILPACLLSKEKHIFTKETQKGKDTHFANTSNNVLPIVEFSTLSTFLHMHLYMYRCHQTAFHTYFIKLFLIMFRNIYVLIKYHSWKTDVDKIWIAKSIYAYVYIYLYCILFSSL